MADRLRPYLFYDVAVSICSTCFRKIEAKIVFEDGNVSTLKRCPAHGFLSAVLIADDAMDYYKRDAAKAFGFSSRPRCRIVSIRRSNGAVPVRLRALTPDHERNSFRA